jgi:hypothetical protein
LDLIELRANVASGDVSVPTGLQVTITGYCEAAISPMNSGGNAVDTGSFSYSLK